MGKTNITWDRARWAKAKDLTKWLDEAYPGGHEALMEYLAASQSSRWQRRYFEWRNTPSSLVDVETTLDEFLIFCGLHLSEVPKHVFYQRFRRPPTRTRLKPEEIEQLLKEATRNGVSAAAKKVKCDPATVRKHLRKRNLVAA